MDWDLVSAEGENTIAALLGQETTMEITEQIRSYREAIRHLWNAYWVYQEPDWDSIDRFAEVADLLFRGTICSLVETKLPVIPVDHGDSPLSAYRLFTKHNGKLPLLVSRDIPNKGSWDHPVSWIPAESAYDIIPICFFDFDQVGHRQIRYYRSRIINSPSHPELNGRDALIECDHVQIEIRA
jgi:hypothetical protein